MIRFRSTSLGRVCTEGYFVGEKIQKVGKKKLSKNFFCSEGYFAGEEIQKSWEGKVMQ